MVFKSLHLARHRELRPFNIKQQRNWLTEHSSSEGSHNIVIQAFWMVWWLWLQNACRRWPRR